MGQEVYRCCVSCVTLRGDICDDAKTASRSPPGGPTPDHRDVYTDRHRAITACNRPREVLKKKDATNQFHQGMGLLCASVSPPARCPPWFCKCKSRVTRGPAQTKPSLWESQCVYISVFAPIPQQTGRAGNLGRAVTGCLSPSPGLFRKQGSLSLFLFF